MVKLPGWIGAQVEMSSVWHSLVAMVVVCGLTLAGCQGKPAAEPSGPHDAAMHSEAEDELPESMREAIAAAMAELSEEDRAQAEQQRICPVSQEPLGSMGVPMKVEVAGREVFICCEGCTGPLQEDPETYLANLE
jgi:hypothetical protein